jgi:asparagine synthase (glutamine-hydrolysing)
MCGIAGAVNWGNLESLDRMTDVLTHRGPDDRGVFETVTADGSWIGLGCRRLAIVDLTPAGHMPMSNADGTIHITYNGEIYNHTALKAELEGKGHRFRSTSDTEVLLLAYQEYGLECLSKLDGMFAFGIWDARRQRLVLARDHFGIKPLYYLSRGQRLAFASEIKSILELPESGCPLDLKAFHQYMTFLWVPDPATAFEGLLKLPAGHVAVYEQGSLKVSRYWDLSFPDADHVFPRSERDLTDELRERFGTTVRGQLRSDVPRGAFLSAGLDSSSIVAAMSEGSREPINTYTIAFPPEYRAGDATLDDPAVAARTARHFGCRHTQILVEPAVVSLLPKLIWHLDEPVADPAIIVSYLVSAEAHKSVTVLLSGVGGDEIFAGYRKHYAHYWANLYRGLPIALRRKIIEPLLARLPTFRDTRARGFVRLLKKMARSASLPSQDAFLMNSTYFDEAEKRDLYSADMIIGLAGEDPWHQHRTHLDRVAHADFLNQMLYLDMKTFMVSLNLTYSDKTSMASSVEVRVPFLSRELVEWVAQEVPPSMKLRGLWNPTTKYLLRRAMAQRLPSEVLKQRKAGFGAPTDYWLTYDLREMVHDLLSTDRIKRRGYFKPRTVARLLDEHYSGRQEWSLQIWQLLTFELWLQGFVDNAGARSAVAH